MKKYLLILSFFAAVINLNAQDLKLMTYNIRLDLDSDGENSWINRKDYFNAQVQFYEPDVFGVQEARPNQVTDISTALPAYRYVGISRDGVGKGEASDIFYKTDRFNLKQSGTFWLSETSDTISKGWDAAYNRVCTYALLFDKQNKKSIWVFNTHLDNEGEIAGTKGIELILSKIKILNKKNLPVVFMGDFNAEPTTELVKYLKTQMDDTRERSIEKPFGPTGTFNNFKHNKPVTLLIDYIFISKASNFVVNKFAVLSDSKDLKYPSDHCPVYVQLNYNK